MVRRMIPITAPATDPKIGTDRASPQTQAPPPSAELKLSAIDPMGHLCPRQFLVQAQIQANAMTPKVTKETLCVIVTSELLIPGDGEPIRKGALVVAGKIIVWVGKSDDIPEKYRSHAKKTIHVPYMMPGLWDCHMHVTNPGDVIKRGTFSLGYIASDPVSNGARLARGAWECIQHGYTSLRDLGGFGTELALAIEDGDIIGPNIYASGACLSQTAGHGDIHQLPAGDMYGEIGVTGQKHGYSNIKMTCVVDGVEECRRGVRLQVRRGAKCIKLLVSGGVVSRDDNPSRAQFCKEELAAIVEEATRMGLPVAAHVHGKAGILAAIDAGVTTLEHVSMADEECIDLIKEKDIIFVATRNVVEMILQLGPDLIPPWMWEKASAMAKQSMIAYQMAIKKGVRIALGTDSIPGVSLAVELEWAVKAGMSNLEAIKAATATAAETVKGQAPLTGQLKVGYEADILGVLENPADDVKVLQKRENIHWVWKAGGLLKGPGVGPWGEDDAYSY